MSGDCMWWAGPIAALDFETTGIDPRTARPVSVALCCLEVDGSHTLRPITRLINCGVEIPADATRVHGITTEVVKRDGSDVVEVLKEVAGVLQLLSERRIPLAIMNARYDWPLLHYELRRHSLSEPPEIYLVDPWVLDIELDRYRRGARRLSDLCSCYGVLHGDAHTALADATAAAKLVRIMARRFPQFVDWSLEELQLRQLGWFVDYRDRTNTYWRKTGTPKQIVGEWPWPDPVDARQLQATAAARG